MVSAALSSSDEPFEWPSPPIPGYWPPPVLGQQLECEIVGLNDRAANGSLLHFLLDEKELHIRLQNSRRVTVLRFDQFRVLTLTPTWPAPALAVKSGAVPFEIVWKDGGKTSGATLGRVEHSAGVFLFPVDDNQSAFRRVFVPASSFERIHPETEIAEWQLLPAGPSIEPDAAADAAVPHPDLSESEEFVLSEVTTPEQLLEQVAAQSRMPIVRIGQALTSLGMISNVQLSEALERQQLDRSVPLGEVLVRMGAVSRGDLQIALARKMGYPLVDLQVFPVAAEALRKVPFEVARRLQVAPLMLHEGRLVIALDDPANRHAAIDEIEFVAQCKVVAVIGKWQDFEAVLSQAYEKIGAVSGSRFASGDTLRPIEFDEAGTTELLQTLEKEGQATTSAEDVPIEQSDNSLVRLINRMILEAHGEGVSDIHIESYPGREKIRIRFRRDGRLYTYLELPPNYRNALIARIKIMCDLDISEKRKPQDGKINFAKFSPQHKIELRVATIPTNNGLEDVVMRILASAKPIPLEKIGLSPRNLAAFIKAVERPYGMVLCVGPTGSGKTTTLHSALMHINTPERKIWTAEDPIEITQTGLRQVQVNPRIDWTFAKALRAFVRADPDVIMVGEIRDEETAKTAIEASLTGHLVLSTLHTNSAPETVTRLLDMGMDPFNFADSLLAVLAQRLVRRL
ncbi:MAG: Flp pilus assembly complex ATPase component TadA, partial [Gammaproteobacteria bacterium]|nr:Flp pilus assembly complex ATPase component TadA [Gammaproteobacteria bacterium]